MKNHSDFVDEPLAIEDLVRVGKEHKCCPFYISKELQNDADIILLPYNYLIDPIARKTLKVSLTGSILIFDEAHNLVRILFSLFFLSLYSIPCFSHFLFILILFPLSPSFFPLLVSYPPLTISPLLALSLEAFFSSLRLYFPSLPHSSFRIAILCYSIYVPSFAPFLPIFPFSLFSCSSCCFV